MRFEEFLDLTAVVLFISGIYVKLSEISGSVCGNIEILVDTSRHIEPCPLSGHQYKGVSVSHCFHIPEAGD